MGTQTEVGPIAVAIQRDGVPAADLTLMKELAKLTGGEALLPEQLGKYIRSIDDKAFSYLFGPRVTVTTPGERVFRSEFGAGGPPTAAGCWARR